MVAINGATNSPVKIDMDTFTTSCINENIFRVTITKSYDMPNSGPYCSRQGEIRSCLEPSMRRRELLYKPPIHYGAVFQQYQFIKLLRRQRKVAFLEIQILAFEKGVPHVLVVEIC